MTQINPYLNFPGTTEVAFNFYKSVFGGEFKMLQRFKDTPQVGNLSEAEGEKIMHIQLPLPGGVSLMATDALESMGQKLIEGNNFNIFIQTNSKEEADKFFSDLSAGGKITMPLEDAFWGAYFGALTDKYGINWMVNYEYPKK